VLTNASKYAPGSAITINCNKSEKYVHLEIADKGSGIPEASLELVFNRFYRVPSKRTNQPPGAGLGLYICRQIIEAHNGKIYAESVSGCGTTIIIILPITNAMQRNE
jgi:signal transduction histidine kinase